MNAQAAGGEGDLLEELPELVEHLRHYEYHLSVEDELRLVTLRAEIQDRGGAARSLDTLERMIAPLVCRNPDEQERLPQILARWHPEKLPEPEVSPAQKAAEREQSRGYRRSQLWWVVAIVVGLALAVLAFRSGIGSLDEAPSPVNGSEALTNGVTIVLAPQPQAAADWTGFARLALALLPIVVAAAFYLRRRRTPAMTRGQAPRDAASRALEIDAGASPLFRPGAVQGALRDLRRHRLVPSDDLDIPRTVAATARAAGFVQFVCRRRFVLPDYLLLNDRASRRDHFGEYGDVLAARLQADQFRTARGEYFGDPTRLVMIGSEGKRRNTDLARLAAEQPDLRILLFADVADFWDPVRAAWRNWVQALAAFETVAVLTPIPSAQWGRRERALAERGFMIVPATSEGISDLAVRLRFDEAGGRVGPGRDEAERLDRLIAAEPYSWEGNTPPAPAKIVELVAALRAALDRGAFIHLCAISVFPAINPRLTEQVGAMLTLADNSPAMTEEGYAAMARLPWLRQARIPDWLRKALIESMAAEDARRVRALWVSLLAKDPGSTEQGIAFDLVPDSPARAVVRSLLRALREDRAAIMAERILLAFLADRRLPDLAVTAPGRLAGERRLPWPDRIDGLVAIAALLAAFALFQWSDAVLQAVRALTEGPDTWKLGAELTLLAAAILLAWWRDRSAGKRSVVAGVLVWAALPAALTLPEFSLAVAQTLGVAAAAAYVFAPPGLRRRMMAGIDPLAIAYGDRWWATSLVLLGTFGLGAVALGYAIENFSSGAWPLGLALNMLLSWLGLKWFSPRLRAAPRFAGQAALAGTALAALCGALVFAFFFLIEAGPLANTIWPLLANLTAVSVVCLVPWVAALTILLHHDESRRFRGPVWLGVAALVAIIAMPAVTAAVSLALASGAFDGSVLLAVLIYSVFVVAPAPLVMMVWAVKRDHKRAQFGLALAGMLVGTVIVIPLAMIGRTLFYQAFEGYATTTAFVMCAAPLAVSWAAFRWAARDLFTESYLWHEAEVGSAAPAPPFSGLRFDLIAVVLIAALSTRFKLYDYAFISLEHLLLPAAAFLGSRLDWRRVRKWFAIGALPLIPTISYIFPGTGIQIGSPGLPGLYLLLLLLVRFAGDAEFRARWLAVDSLPAAHAAFLVFVLGAFYTFGAQPMAAVLAGWDVGRPLRWLFTDLLVALCFLVGYSGAPARLLSLLLAAGAAVSSLLLMATGDFVGYAQFGPLRLDAPAPLLGCATACGAALIAGRSMRPSGRAISAAMVLIAALLLLLSIEPSFQHRNLIGLFWKEMLVPIVAAAAWKANAVQWRGVRLVLGLAIAAVLLVIALPGGSDPGGQILMANGLATVRLVPLSTMALLPILVASWLLGEMVQAYRARENENRVPS